MTLSHRAVPSFKLGRMTVQLVFSVLWFSACGGGDNTPPSITTGSPQSGLAQPSAASLTPPDWLMLVGEGQTFDVPSNTQVRYGRNDVDWVIKTVSGSGICSNEFFGFDSKPEGYRHCYVLAKNIPPPESNQPRATCDLPNFAQNALDRINRFRASTQNCGSQGVLTAVPPLKWNIKLNQASQTYSQDMADRDFFDHTSGSKNGKGIGLRIWTDAQYPPSAIGENIFTAQGPAPSLDQALEAWEKSPGHCGNVMSPSFNEVGLACISKKNSSTYLWTMTLGGAGQ
jgi:uncharacterized protein YkwD